MFKGVKTQLILKAWKFINFSNCLCNVIEFTLYLQNFHQSFNQLLLHHDGISIMKIQSIFTEIFVHFWEVPSNNLDGLWHCLIHITILKCMLVILVCLAHYTHVFNELIDSLVSVLVNWLVVHHIFLAFVVAGLDEHFDSTTFRDNFLLL